MKERNLSKLKLNKNGEYIEIDSNNRVMLRGVNLVNKIAPYEYNDLIKPIEKHLSYLNRMGFNFVRLGICWDGVEPKIGTYNDKYIKNLADFINLLGSHGFYTLLDFHQDQYSKALGGWGHPDWSIVNKDEISNSDGQNTIKKLGFPAAMFNNLIIKEEKGKIVSVPHNVSNTFHLFWENKPIQSKGINDRYIDMVIYTIRKMKKFCNMNYICGIDIMNEPWPGVDWLDAYKDEHIKIVDGKKYTKKTVDLTGNIWSKEGSTKIDAKLTKFYKKLVTRFVKEISDNSLILYLEPFMIFGSGCPSGINFNEIVKNHSNLQLIFSFHNYTVDSKVIFKNLKKQMDLYNKVNNNRLGYVMTEYGAHFDPDKWSKDILCESDKLNLNWTYWTYIQNLNYIFTENLLVNPNYDYKKQAIYYNDSKKFSLSNINLDIVNALSKPYPMKVSLKENGKFNFKNYKKNNKNISSFVLTHIVKGGKIVIATPPNYFNKYSYKIYYAKNLNKLLNSPSLLQSGTGDSPKFVFNFKDNIFDENPFVKIVFESIGNVVDDPTSCMDKKQKTRRKRHRKTKRMQKRRIVKHTKKHRMTKHRRARKSRR